MGSPARFAKPKQRSDVVIRDLQHDETRSIASILAMLKGRFDGPYILATVSAGA